MSSLIETNDCPIPGITLTIKADTIHVASDDPLRVLSSAFVGGDLHVTRHIVNMHVPKGYDCRHASDDVVEFAKRIGIAEPVIGMMTAAYTDNAGVATESREGLAVTAIITAGLSNATNAGLTSPAARTVGTINTILLLDAALTSSAMANAIISATEAKTLTLIERNVRTREGDLASGTSTDAVVVACTGRGEPLLYAGTATVIGWLIARTVRAALTQSLDARERVMRQ